MPACLGGLSQLAPQRVFKLVVVVRERFQFAPGVSTWIVAAGATVNVDGLADVLVEALGGLEPEIVSVRPRALVVENQHNGPAVLGADHRVADVAHVELFRGHGMVFPEDLGRELIVRGSVVAHRHEVVEGVAAVDAHPLGRRGDVMGRVGIAHGSAHRLARERGRAVRVERVEQRILLITGIDVHGIAEDAVADHVQNAHHLAEVAVVLHHGTVPLGLF